MYILLNILWSPGSFLWITSLVIAKRQDQSKLSVAFHQWPWFCQPSSLVWAGASASSKHIPTQSTTSDGNKSSIALTCSSIALNYPCPFWEYRRHARASSLCGRIKLPQHPYYLKRCNLGGGVHQCAGT